MLPGSLLAAVLVAPSVTVATRLVYEGAVVRSGSSSVCYLNQINSSNIYSGMRPVLGSAGGNVGYISLSGVTFCIRLRSDLISYHKH